MDRAVIATADELFAGRHFPGVVAMCNDALEDEPECVELLLIRARAHIKLRRDLDAQADLRDVIRLAPASSLAYRLLGELAARRDENDSAGIFFREALRLSPDDVEAAEWLQIVETTLRPGVRRHPAPAPFGIVPGDRFPDRPTQPRFARGTRAPDEVPTKPFPRGSERKVESIERTLELLSAEADGPLATQEAKRYEVPALPLPAPPPVVKLTPQHQVTTPGVPNLAQRPAPPRKPPPLPKPARTAMPEIAGFADYLVDTGILSRERLRAAQAYQRSMKVQLSTAIVTLGLATPQRIEWAAVAHQSQLARS